MRKVDACAHIFPRSFWDKMQARAGRLPDIGDHSNGMPLFTNLDQRFQLMDRFDAYEQILSLAGPALDAVFTPDVAGDLARYANDALAELTGRHPYRFPGFFAALSIADPDAAMTEIHRAVKELGALGVQLLANAAGPMLDRADYAVIFHACYDLDVPISLYPAPGADRAMAGLQSHLVFSGLMDDLPGVKIMSPQLGGLTTLMERRIGPQTLRPLKKPYAEYFKDFYANTALSRTRDAVAGGLSYHPRDRMMFATATSDDGAAGIREQIQVVESLEIDTEWKQDIFWRNAAKIMSFDRREDTAPVKPSTYPLSA
jgi:aminocarboxymuconate-semialdehyde decarboxylase